MKIAHLSAECMPFAKTGGLGDVAALIFNTHGESMGRGAHPGSFEDRLAWPLSPWARRRFVRAGLAASGKDAKRLIAEGGAKVNDEIVTDSGLRYGASHLAEPMKLTAGKKRHALVVLG